MWKTKSIVFLETMDYFMLDLVNHRPHILMYQSMVSNAPAGGLKQNLQASYDEEDKRLISSDVKAGDAFENSLPYHIYHLVQNYESA